MLEDVFHQTPEKGKRSGGSDSGLKGVLQTLQATREQLLLRLKVGIEGRASDIGKPTSSTLISSQPRSSNSATAA